MSIIESSISVVLQLSTKMCPRHPVYRIQRGLRKMKDFRTGENELTSERTNVCT